MLLAMVPIVVALPAMESGTSIVPPLTRVPEAALTLASQSEPENWAALTKPATEPGRGGPELLCCATSIAANSSNVSKTRVASAVACFKDWRRPRAIGLAAGGLCHLGQNIIANTFRCGTDATLLGLERKVDGPLQSMGKNFLSEPVRV